MSTLFCGSCRQLRPFEDCSQLVPCLHTVCLPCIQQQIHKCQLCPVTHCYSPLVQQPDQKWNCCQSESCQRKLSYAQDATSTICQHDLCAKCYDDAYKADAPVCPVLNCNVLLEEEEREKCDGPCGASFDSTKLQMLPCCRMRICSGCIEKWTEGQDCCPKGKCQPAAALRKKGKKAIIVRKVPCKGMVDCEGEVLRNFPSEQECEHACCLSCLGAILNECELKGCPPICPAESCRLPYRCETVLALKAHFSERAAYFDRFDLEYFSMEALKDDTIAHIQGKGTEVVRLTEIKACFCEDDDNQQVVEMDLENGTLGDLLRELRRIMKIMPWDKVYGYFRRDSPDGENKPLAVKQKTIHMPLRELKITKDTLILVDITGIVNSKKRNSAVAEKKKPLVKSREMASGKVEKP